MQNKHRIFQFGDVDDAELSCFITDAYLPDTFAYGGHGLEILRLKPMLDAVQLIASLASC